MHPQRAALSVMAGRTKLIVGHQAPLNAQGVTKLQLAGHAVIREEFQRNNAFGLRPVILGWDANADVNSRGVSPQRLADLVGGRVYNGGRIDNYVARNITKVRPEVVEHVKGVSLRSDHGHAVRLDFDIKRFWLGL